MALLLVMKRFQHTAIISNNKIHKPMRYFKSAAIIFIEVNEAGKAPDLKYITEGDSDPNRTDEEFEDSAVAYLKVSVNYPVYLV